MEELRHSFLKKAMDRILVESDIQKYQGALDKFSGHEDSHYGGHHEASGPATGIA